MTRWVTLACALCVLSSCEIVEESSGESSGGWPPPGTITRELEFVAIPEAQLDITLPPGWHFLKSEGGEFASTQNPSIRGDFGISRQRSASIMEEGKLHQTSARAANPQCRFTDVVALSETTAFYVYAASDYDPFTYIQLFSREGLVYEFRVQGPNKAAIDKCWGDLRTIIDYLRMWKH